MQRIDGRFVYSASDLNGYLECAALTHLDREAADRLRVRPEPDETTQLIARKGDEHERRYLETLRRRGLEICEISKREHAGAHDLLAAERETLAAMERGVPVIYQGTFFDGTFMGHADFLRRVERPSQNRPWSYEVVDTKLALSTKTYFLVQLCNYSEHVARLQGTMPKRLVVVAGNNAEAAYDVAEYFAYYRHLKASFLAHAASDSNGAYPHEVPHCRVCRWSPICERRRDEDDYLGLVAWMRRDDIRRLASAGVTTMTQLARASATTRPDGMKTETFERLRDQARLQHVTRTTGKLEYELLGRQDARGFTLLPLPDDGDVFFDMEGDPLYTPERGLEYLFGVYLAKEERYVAYWARSDREERAAFESLVDFLEQRRAAYPSMHVYHYAPYEMTALKRLSGFYGTREDELDRLLRAQAFVDLYAVVRQGLRISQPSYSIKRLEPFYGFTRDTKTKRGDDSILMFESWLVDGDDNILVDIENYNRDDCISTLRLRNWLLERRAELAARDGEFDWKRAPEPKERAEDAEADERDATRARLLDGLEAPESLAALRASPESYRARWLLGHLLDYHRRDEKPAWWAYFHRCENRDELVEFDRHAIGGLRYREDIPPYRITPRQNPVYAFEFPEQIHGFERGDGAYVLDASNPHDAGTVVELDEDNLLVRLKLHGSVDPAALDAIAPVPTIPAGAIRESLGRVAAAYLDGSLEERHRALVDVLLRRPPRLNGSSGDALQPATPDADAIADLAQRLDASYLFVQGPPGTGKSTTGAEVILNLLKSGKRVAILANSHKVIHNLLHKIEERAEARGQRFAGVQRYSKSTPGSCFESRLASSLIVCSADTGALDAPHDLAAGTAWTFAREEATAAYDYLFIDEAGQVSLANAVACAPCARNIVLLGDPLQLAQVSQGAHPPGIELSVMEHVLGDEPTIPSNRGVFLDRSYRMHRSICDFISESVYANRLRAADATDANRIDAPGLTGSGLRYLPIRHEGNSRESPEEAEAIARAAAELLRGTVCVATQTGVAPTPRRLTERDILVVSPYNAQRRLIGAMLRAAGMNDVPIGTVDKFQGQEAPVVFYSMATSSGDALPRDLGFLFEKNRFNVAVSRAQCMSVLVCSPRLLEIRCSTPQQMALVNLLCRFVELASPLSLTAPRG